MSYEPTNWKDGDLVTSAKLNKIEQGIAGNNGSSILKVGMVLGEEMRLDKTFKEIRDAIKEQIPVYACGGNDNVFTAIPIVAVVDYEDMKQITALFLGDNGFEPLMFYAQTENDYPSTNPTDDDDDDDNEESDGPDKVM